ncbi:MAG: amylo-alpha-1,6-glucosidase [Deltaproteobacteria bacterium]|nr:amylo-alpha-1,6-glucosidase [Deltaproteobacteria bacterium]
MISAPASVAELLELPQAPEPERLVLSRGNIFSVTITTGNIVPPGARDLGVFHQDTRHLSYYELVLPGPSPTRLSAETSSAVAAQIDLTTTDREFGGLLDEPINFLHVRRKQILDEDDFVDQLIFLNYLGRPVDLEFDVRFGADFADVFEVRGARRPRRGEYLSPQVRRDRVELRYRGLDREEYHTTLRFTPEPVALEASRAHFRLRLDPGEAQVQEVVITPWRGEQDPDRPLWPFDVRVARAHREMDDFQTGCARTRCDNNIIQRAFERALSDVFALRICHESRSIVGAGIPWFAAPFGRDSLITSMQMLGFAPSLSGETLRFLGLHQGKNYETMREEEPGKIMHELRRGEMVRAGEIPHSPYYGSVDATPLYVILAGELYRWMNEKSLLAEAWPHVVASMEWIERHTEQGTRFLSYKRVSPRGLENQGWKDSRDGVSFPDGRRAQAPVSLVEVQGYAVDAYRRGAQLARAMGELELADKWLSRVAPLIRQIDEAFWNEETSFYALALDGSGRQVPTISSNPGHLLWSRAVPEERASRLAGVLLGPEMYSGWGIRTVGRGQTVYNPISYHNGTVWPHDNAVVALGMSRYGLHDAAMRVLEGMFAASEHFRYQRLPELFCGTGRGDREFLVHYPVSCSPQAWASGALFMLLQAALGLDPNAPEGRLRIWNPRLPASVRRIELRSMRVGQALVSLRFTRSGKRTHADVLDVHGGPLRVEIEVD